VNKKNARIVQYRLTAHAKNAIAERRISLAWIFRVPDNPLALEVDRADPALRHALGRIPERGDRILRVVYNETVKPWSVVTAFFDRKASKLV
jgi:hypothetical protein